MTEADIYHEEHGCGFDPMLRLAFPRQPSSVNKQTYCLSRECKWSACLNGSGIQTNMVGYRAELAGEGVRRKAGTGNITSTVEGQYTAVFLLSLWYEAAGRDKGHQWMEELLVVSASAKLSQYKRGLLASLCVTKSQMQNFLPVLHFVQ